MRSSYLAAPHRRRRHRVAVALELLVRVLLSALALGRFLHSYKYVHLKNLLRVYEMRYGQPMQAPVFPSVQLDARARFRPLTGSTKGANSFSWDRM